MSRPYSVTISIFRSSCSSVRLESPTEISRREETSCIYIRVCVCVRAYILCMHMQLARCITSFGRSRRLLDISRFLFFPSRSPLSVLPSSSFCSSDAPVPMHVIHARMFVFERALCSTCRGSLPMHANPVSELSKCTRKCITRTWEPEKGGRGGGRGKGSERGS